MRRNIVAGLLGITLLSACNIEPADIPPGDTSTPTGAPATRHQALTCVSIPPTPAVPTAPRDLALMSYPYGPQIPRTARTAYTAFYPHPTDRNRFMAIGFDVRSSQTLFYVTGYVSRHYRPFREQLNADIDAIYQSGDVPTDFSEGMGGYVTGPGSPGPGPGIHDPHEAWKATYQSWLVNTGG